MIEAQFEWTPQTIILTAPAAAWLACSGPSLNSGHMLDQQDLIARLIEDHFVNELLRKKNTETARSHTLGHPIFNMF